MCESDRTHVPITSKLWHHFDECPLSAPSAPSSSSIIRQSATQQFPFCAQQVPPRVVNRDALVGNFALSFKERSWHVFGTSISVSKIHHVMMNRIDDESLVMAYES